MSIIGINFHLLKDRIRSSHGRDGLNTRCFYKDGCYIHGKIEKLFFITFNLISNHIISRSYNHAVDVRRFIPECYEYPSKKKVDRASPMRLMARFFLNYFPWEKVVTELDSLHVLELGCGNGLLFKWIDNLTQKVSQYVGIDNGYEENYAVWEKLRAVDSRFNVINANVENIKQIPKKTNLIISNFFLEHYRNDLQLFAILRDSIKRNHNTCIQIHIVPPVSALRSYGVHGYRQYTLQAINRMLSLYSDFSNCYTFVLGGKSCNAVHHKYFFDLHRDFLHLKQRKFDLRSYNRDLSIAIKRDFQAKKIKFSRATLYTCVIHSYPKQELFD